MDRDAGESLVYLDQVQVIRAPSGSFEREFARVSWNSEQVGRFLGYFGVRHDGAERFEAALFGEALAREQVERMCAELLANPLIESYEITLQA